MIQKWAQTEAGVDFISAGPDAYVFVVRQRGGEYVVAWCGAERGQRFARFVCCGEVPQRWCICGKREERTQAVAFTSRSEQRARMLAEALAVDMGGEPFAGGGWRELPPTRMQVAKARAVGVDIPKRVTELGASVPGVTGGELADMITKVLGSKRIDGLAEQLVDRSAP